MSRIKESLNAARLNRRLKSLNADSRSLCDRPNAPWKIEIMVPTYNHAEFLEKTWLSAYEQDYKGEFVITVIDDCSSDDTQKVIQKLKAKKLKKSVRANYIQNPSNLRQHGSLNAAIKVSSADIIVILNDDDLLTPDALTFIQRAFLDNKEIFLLGSTSIWFTDDTKIQSLTQSRRGSQHVSVVYPSAVRSYRKLNDLNMTHTSMAFFKCAWESVGGYTSKENRIHPLANEDRDFQMRINALYPVGVYEDYPLALWRTDSSHGKDF